MAKRNLLLEYSEKLAVCIANLCKNNKFDSNVVFQIKKSSSSVFANITEAQYPQSLARNRYDSARYKILLKKNDVRVISATEAISQGAEGIILETVLEGMAEYYSADLSEKVSRGMKENALKCVYLFLLASRLFYGKCKSRSAIITKKSKAFVN